MMRKGLLTFDAVVGIVISFIVIGVILFGAFRVENLTKARRIAEADSVLASYLAKGTAECKNDPNWSLEDTVTLKNDTFDVKVSCSPVTQSLIEVDVEVKGEGIDLKGTGYASR